MREGTYGFVEPTMIFGWMRVIGLTIVFSPIVAEEVGRWLNVEDVDLYNPSKNA